MTKSGSVKRVFKTLLTSVAIFIVIFICYFFTIKKLDDAEAKNSRLFSCEDNSENAHRLPSLFSGDRFYIKVCSVNGDTLLAFGDSGGGRCMLMTPVVDKLELDSKTKMAIWHGIMPIKYIPVLDVIRDNQIPFPLQLRSFILRTPFKSVRDRLFLIPKANDEINLLMHSIPLDIFLGQNFFMGRSWTFDYIKKEVWVNTPIAKDQQDTVHIQTIGFKKNSNHENIYGHASMFIEVNGEIIEVLFDTGATIILSEQGKKAFNTSEKTIGGSFIAASVFNKWRKEHPDWKFYEKADFNNDVIEVPSVKVCGYEVGPVLFAKRNDENWSKWMISSMDTVVRGAIGGSLLKYFKVTVDYNSERIKFEK